VPDHDESAGLKRVNEGHGRPTSIGDFRGFAMGADDEESGSYGIILSVLTRMWDWLTSHRWLVIVVLILLPLIWEIGRAMASYRHRKVVLYTGTTVADANRMGETVRNYFRDNNPSSLIHYEVELRPSEGLRENRKKVADASSQELVIGFDQDGFDPPESVRTLIPLTELYLHIVARQTDVAEAYLGPSLANQPPTLRRMQEWFAMRPPSPAILRRTMLCYIGPKGSGSRQIAEQVFRYYDIKLQQVDFGDFADWDTAYRMLEAGDIDLIFDASDFGSPSIAQRAQAKQFALIGLDDVQGLVAGQQNSMLVRRIPKGSYFSDSVFCRGDLDTVATQRLIICNKAMSPFDAYYLTAGIREGLRQSVPSVTWEKTEQPSPKSGLVCPLHDGVEDFRHQRRPLTWVYSLLERNWFAGLSFLFGFVVFLWPHLKRRKAPAKKPSPPAPSSDGAPAPATGPGLTPPEGHALTTAPRTDLPAPIRTLLDQCDHFHKELSTVNPQPAKKTVRELRGRFDHLCRSAKDLETTFDKSQGDELALVRTYLGRLGMDLTCVEKEPGQAAQAAPTPATT
jgi:TRAP-type uncharacterized transport system substrate-binding protein